MGSSITARKISNAAAASSLNSALKPRAPDQNIVDGYLAEHSQHEADGNEKRRYPAEMRHDDEKRRLGDGNDGKDDS